MFDEKEMDELRDEFLFSELNDCFNELEQDDNENFVKRLPSVRNNNFLGDTSSNDGFDSNEMDLLNKNFICVGTEENELGLKTTSDLKETSGTSWYLNGKSHEVNNEFKEIDETFTHPDSSIGKNSGNRNGWASDHLGLWHSGPSSLNLSHSSKNHGTNRFQDLTSSVTYNPYEPQSLGNFSTTSKRTYSHQQLGAKVEMVYNLLSMLDMDNREDMSKTFLAMSSSVESCHAMRQSGCLPLLIQLIHSVELDKEVRKRAAEALHNVVHAQSDEKRRRREIRVLKLLQQVREYCDELRDVCGTDGSPDKTMQDPEKHPINSIGTLMKFSFDAEHRQAICVLGGLHAITELIQMDHEAHGTAGDDSVCVTLRRYAGMALTNLTFGDGKNKALLCSFNKFMRALVDQLKSHSEDLRQVTASVLRNLSWRADSESKQALRDVGAVTALTLSAMEGKKESTLKSILSALWNLSAHCSLNKIDICSVPGALAFFVRMLRYKSASNTLAIVENAGGILRNISSHIAVREDYRQILRDNNCFEVLLEHLKSPSLTVVSNACGTLWNLSARCAEDQRRLWEMGAVSMLRSLVQSKHKMISMGSSAALKNLLTASPNENLLTHLDSTAKSLGLQSLPALFVRKKRALEQELNITLAETCENIDPIGSPTYGDSAEKKDKNDNGPKRSESYDSVQSAHSDSVCERINQIAQKNEEKLLDNKNLTLHDSLDEKSMPKKVEDQKLMRRYKASMIPTPTFKKLNQDRINEKTKEETILEQKAASEIVKADTKTLDFKEKPKKAIPVLNVSSRSKKSPAPDDNLSSSNTIPKNECLLSQPEVKPKNLELNEDEQLEAQGENYPGYSNVPNKDKECDNFKTITRQCQKIVNNTDDDNNNNSDNISTSNLNRESNNSQIPELLNDLSEKFTDLKVQELRSECNNTEQSLRSPNVLLVKKETSNDVFLQNPEPIRSPLNLPEPVFANTFNSTNVAGGELQKNCDIPKESTTSDFSINPSKCEQKKNVTTPSPEPISSEIFPKFKIGSPMTDSKALQLEVSKVCREIKKHQDIDMGCSLTSEVSLISCSSFLDTGDISLFDSSTDVLDLTEDPESLLSAKNFASRLKNITSQKVEPVSLPSLGSLKNDQLEGLDLDNSVLSVASITSEIADTYSKDPDVYNTYTKTYKPETVEETVADVTLLSDGEETLNADNNCELFDEDNSIHSQENLPFDADSRESTPDRLKRKLTPKEKRKTFHERYKTYTIRNITTDVAPRSQEDENCYTNGAQLPTVRDIRNNEISHTPPSVFSTERRQFSKSFDKEKNFVTETAYDSKSLENLLSIGPDERQELVNNAKLVAFSLKTAVQEPETTSDSEMEEQPKSYDIDTATYTKNFRGSASSRFRTQETLEPEPYVEPAAAEEYEVKGARILKPSEISEETVEEVPKGIRGRRKPLYYSPQKTLSGNEGKKPLGNAEKSPPQLQREGTFVKETGTELKKTESKNVKGSPRKSLESKVPKTAVKSKINPPSGGTSKTQVSKIGRPSVSYLPQKRNESDTSQRPRPYSAGTPTRAGGDSLLKKAPGLNASSSKLKNSSSNQNIRASSKNFGFQTAKSQSDASLHLVESKDKIAAAKQKTPSKEVTSKIASLWKKVEETKQKNKDVKDHRVWIGPEKTAKSGGGGDEAVVVVEQEEILEIPTRKIVHSYTCQTLGDDASSGVESRRRDSRNPRGFTQRGNSEERKDKSERRNILSAVVPPYNYSPPVSSKSAASDVNKSDTFHKGSLKITAV